MNKMFKVPVIIDPETGTREADLNQIPEIAELRTKLAALSSEIKHETFYIRQVVQDLGTEMDVESIDGSTEEGRLRGCKLAIEEWIERL